MNIKQIYQESTEFAILIFYRWRSFNRYPQIGEYKNKTIQRAVPCVKRGGKFFDLRTGEKVEKNHFCVEWPLMRGCVLRYPDGVQLILSRHYRSGQILLMEISDEEFRPMSMSRADLCRY